jgi:hypothetical protein
MYNFVNIKIDYEDIQKEIDNQAGWQTITPKEWNLGYEQKYKEYKPEWLVNQLLPVWSYMGLLIAAKSGQYLTPHVDNGRTAGILIPCTKSYQDTSLDFWDIPEWDGIPGNDKKFVEHTGKIIDSVKYNDPILFKNVPHGVDNTKSKYDRINLSICFLYPYTYEVLKDLNEKGLLIR